MKQQQEGKDRVWLGVVENMVVYLNKKLCILGTYNMNNIFISPNNVINIFITDISVCTLFNKGINALRRHAQHIKHRNFCALNYFVTEFLILFKDDQNNEEGENIQ